MGNPLRNAMVYLGLAEEDDIHYTEPAPEAAQSRPRPAPETHAVREEAPVEHAKPAPVTPITKAPRVVSRTPAVGEMNEILTVHPKAFNKDAKLIADTFRDNIPVIMNLSEMDDGDARRLIDFASGLAQGLSGNIKRVTNRVFLLTPATVSVSGGADERSSDAEASFLP